MTTMDNVIIGRMFRAAQAAVLIVNGEGDHADLRREIERYEKERERDPMAIVELESRWGEV